MNREFQRKQREFREDLNQRRNEELAQVVEQANRVIRQIAEQEKFDIIFQDAVFASPRIDITDKVIKALERASRRRSDAHAGAADARGDRLAPGRARRRRRRAPWSSQVGSLEHAGAGQITFLAEPEAPRQARRDARRRR